MGASHSNRGRFLPLLLLGALLLAVLPAGCGQESEDSTTAPAGAGAESGAERATSATRTGGGDEDTSGNDYIEVLSTTPPYEVPDDLLSAEPLVESTVEEMWEKSLIPREMLDDPVARVNGEVLTYRDLALECMARYGETPLTEFVNACVTLAEIRGRGFEIEDDEIEEAIGEILDYTVKIRRKDLYYLRKRATESYLKLLATMRVGLERSYASDAGKPRFDPEEDLLFMSAYQQVFYQRYDIRLLTEWGSARLGNANAATVGGISIPADTAIPIVMARTCDNLLDQSLEDLIDATLVRQELERQKVEFDPAEADYMVASRRQTGSGAIPWEAIIRMKGRMNLEKTESMAWIRRKFDLWVGLDLLLGELDELEIAQYFQDQQVMIGRGAIKAARVEVRTLEQGNCRRKNPEGRAKARLKADKAMAELDAGTEFSSVVMKFSENPAARRYVDLEVRGEEIRVAGDPKDSNIRDSSLPDSVAAAAFFAPAGEWIGPIQTRTGYVFLEVIGVKPPVPYPYDPEPFEDVNGNGRWDEGEPFEDIGLPNGTWDMGRKRFAWNELRGDRALAWVADLRKTATIEVLR